MPVINAAVTQLFLGQCCSPSGSPDIAKIAKGLIPGVNAIISGFLGWSPALAEWTEFLPTEKTPARKKFGIDFGPGGQNGVSNSGGGEFPGASGNQMPFLTLLGRPCRSITELYVNPNAWSLGTDGGDWPAETLQDVGTYYLDFVRPDTGTPSMTARTGKLYRRFGSFWDTTPRSIKVIYQAGLSETELANEYADITMAYGLTLSAWLAKVLATRSIGSASNAGQVAGKVVSSVSVKDFAVSFASGLGAGQFGGGTGGNSGGAGAGIPDEAAAILARHVSMGKYLN